MLSIRRWISAQRIVQPVTRRCSLTHSTCKARWIGSYRKADGNVHRDQQGTSMRSSVVRLVGRRCYDIWRNRYKRSAVAGAAIVAASLYYSNLELVPITGRERFNILPNKLLVMIAQYGAEGWIENHLEEDGHLINFWDARLAMTRRVMKRLVHVSGLTDVDWRIYVLDDSTIMRTFVLPNGSVFMYSGMLDVCQTEDGLAALLGHEIAHVMASHSAETVSAVLARNTIVGGVFFVAGGLPGLLLFGLWNVLGGYIFEDILYHLPKSRLQESEADFIGLLLMAEAGYDPQEAVRYWQRMESAHGGDGETDSEYLRTHPLDEERISKLIDWMPQALAKHEESSWHDKKAASKSLSPNLAVIMSAREDLNGQ